MKTMFHEQVLSLYQRSVAKQCQIKKKSWKYNHKFQPHTDNVYCLKNVRGQG